jgi:hypothetical protein
VPREICSPPQVLPAEIAIGALALKPGFSTFEGTNLRALPRTSHPRRLKGELVAFITAHIFGPSWPFQKGSSRWTSDGRRRGTGGKRVGGRGRSGLRTRVEQLWQRLGRDDGGRWSLRFHGDIGQFFRLRKGAEDLVGRDRSVIAQW